MWGTGWGKRDNTRHTPGSKRALEYACVTKTERERPWPMLSLHFWERGWEKGREARVVSCAPSSASPGSGTERSHFPSGAGWHISTMAAVPPSCLYLCCTQLHKHTMHTSWTHVNMHTHGTHADTTQTREELPHPGPLLVFHPSTQTHVQTKIYKDMTRCLSVPSFISPVILVSFQSLFFLFLYFCLPCPPLSLYFLWAQRVGKPEATEAVAW